ncbi:DinB family protein [Terrimonas alba]|uniref:DinB family protein n=1 Tax=Terrimonas alba TaxID=3349636 RepID=UPI0035F4276E
MLQDQQMEFWQKGPVEDIIPLLQPVAHAILQAQHEVQLVMNDFPGTLLWQRPAGVASPAFHLQHLSGVLDRLFTYARGEQLTPKQLNVLRGEGKENSTIHLTDLLVHFSRQVEKAIQQLKDTKEDSLLEIRYVGRKQIPSNVLGLLFHAAEHIQRHTGQLLVTARIVKQLAG